MTIVPVLWGTAAMVLAVWAQVRLTQGFLGDAVLLFGAALLIFLLQFGLQNAAALSRYRRPGPAGLPLLPRRWWFAVGGLAFGAGAALLAVMAWREFFANEPYTSRGWWLHIASVACVPVAAYLLDGLGTPFPRRSEDDDPAPLRRLTVGVTLAVLVLLALLLRIWRFDALPFGTWYDEANHVLQAMRILNSPDYRPIFDGTTNSPTHYLYMVTVALRFMEPTAQAARSVSVVLGVLCVPAGYLLGRELFDARSGLVLAALLAVSSWSITFSRMGMFANMSTPLFALLTAGFLLLALRTLRYSAFAWTGIWLGLGLNFYTSFRLFVFVVAAFLIYYIVVEWLWRRERLSLRFWIGLAIIALAALAVVAPLALFAQKHPELFWSRVQDTFIFADKTPDQRWPALWENVRKHVLMFNWRGDPNGRHNLPGAPMLDNISAGLLVLGLGLALWRWRDPVWMLLPLWLAGTLLGGILSLDFEAPQSLRANGAMPVVYALTVAPVFVTWRTWRLRDGRYFPNAPAIVLVLLLMVPLLVVNVRRYYDDQAHDFATWAAHSTAETVAANLLADLDPGTDAYVISFFQHHPTVDLIARNAAPYGRLETTDNLPLTFEPARGALLIMDGERAALFREAQRLYPNAQFIEHRAPFGGPPVVYSARLSPEDVAGIQGLTASYYPNAAWDEPPLMSMPQTDFDVDWALDAPLAAPFGVEWTGILRAPEYGIYQFQVEAPGETELLINENSVLSGYGTMLGALVLAEGNHPIRMRTVVDDPADPGRFAWLWRPPDRGPEIMPGTVLYSSPVRNNGLLGRYFPNGDWSGGEAFARIDPQLDLYFHNPPLARPYTVEWTGKLAIPEPGDYRFGLQSIDESTLWIDGQEITASTVPNMYADGSVTLEPGLHDIRVRFGDRTAHTNIHLYWSPPWGGNEIVPAEVLFPPQASYDRIDMPTALQLRNPDGAPGDRAVAGPDIPVAPALVEEVIGALTAPRGVALRTDGVAAVADTGAATLLVISSDGGDVRMTTGTQRVGNATVTLVEPYDVAFQADGTILMLDPGAASIGLFEPTGEAAGVLPLDPVWLDRARGFGLTTRDTLWVARTPLGSIVEVTPDGELLRELPVWPGADSQPVDVAESPVDSHIYVTDGGVYKLIRFDASGRRLLAWDLPPFNSIDGSHVAVAPDGMVYVTIPEAGQVWAFGADGIRQAALQLPDRNGVPARPVGIDVGPNGEIWVTDVANGRILRILSAG